MLFIGSSLSVHNGRSHGVDLVVDVQFGVCHILHLHPGTAVVENGGVGVVGVQGSVGGKFFSGQGCFDGCNYLIQNFNFKVRHFSFFQTYN